MPRFRETFKIEAFKNFANHTGKTPMLESPFNKTASTQGHSFIKERLQHRYFPVKPAKPPTIPLLTKHL